MNTPRGTQGDDLRVWALCGVFSAQWDHLLLSQGVSPKVATAALLGIKGTVCETAPELWREVCAHVHDAGAANRSGTSLQDEISHVFARWDGSIPGGLDKRCAQVDA